MGEPCAVSEEVDYDFNQRYHKDISECDGA